MLTLAQQGFVQTACCTGQLTEDADQRSYAPWDERHAGRGGGGRQRGDVRPGLLGVYVILGHRRHAAEIVRARAQQRPPPARRIMTRT